MPQDDPVERKGSFPTVEQEAYSIEDVGIASQNKIDQLLDTAVNVRQELQVHTRRVVIGLSVAAVLFSVIFGLAFGVLLGLRSQSSDIRQITSDNLANGNLIRENSNAIRESTGPEAAARTNARIAGAITELQRVGVCAALYVVKEIHPACEDVTASMDRVRAGEEFSR